MVIICIALLFPVLRVVLSLVMLGVLRTRIVKVKSQTSLGFVFYKIRLQVMNALVSDIRPTSCNAIMDKIRQN